MNIFENYLTKINSIITENRDLLDLKNFKNLKSVNLEVPPEKFNYDLSTNVSLVLSKENQKDPNTLANEIKKLTISKK